MTIKEALKWGEEQLKLKKRNIYLNIYFLDAEILLAEAIKKPREFLHTYPEKKLTPAQETKYKKFIARRAKYEPVAYIIGKKEFYGQEFLVSPDVLIPRPETELLVDVAKSAVGTEQCSVPTIIDIGTGSGAIAITLKKLFPGAQVFGTDRSEGAIKLARKNAHRLYADIKIKKADLLSGRDRALLCPYNNLIITANLPYLSEQEWRETMPDVKKYEPKSALVGGKEGWELYEKLFKQITRYVDGHLLQDRRRCPSTTLIIEIGHNQKTQIIKLLKKHLNPKKIEDYKDLSKKWRIVSCQL